MEQDFYRIKRLPRYVFAEASAMKARARAPVRDAKTHRYAAPQRRTAVS